MVIGLIVSPLKNFDMGDIIEQDAVESVNLSLLEEYISSKERVVFLVVCV